MSVKFDDNTRKVLADIKAREEKGLYQGLLYFAGQAGQNTPTDTGRLKGSIVSSAKIKSSGKGGVTGNIGTNVEYAIYIEYGTVKMKAFAMFRKTAENEKKEIENIIANVLNNG